MLPPSPPLRPQKARDGSDGPRVPPWVIGLLLFILVGGAIFQIIQSAMAGSPLSG